MIEVTIMDKLKQRLKQADWWEITYLFIYGAVFTFEFLNTTMFEVKWPPKFAYIFLASTALYVIAKFIWHNTYTKKEMIWAGIILFAFLMPALLTEYRFLWYTGFLIVGAKDIDFDKILKVYLVLGITIMLAAFVASQCGWIENLVYESWNRGQRNSYGIIYPTDFAAHVFYLSLAGICKSENMITKGKMINLIVLAIFVYDKCEARTSFICLVIMACLLFVITLYKQKTGTSYLYCLINFSTIGCAFLFLFLTHIYDESKVWMNKIDGLLSGRLTISNSAINLYEYKLFGQNVVEVGLGRSSEYVEDYFFLDDSYIRIILLYGIVIFVIALCMFWINGIRAIEAKRIIILCAIAVIGVHSFVEHHLLELAYNPFLFLSFAQICNKTEEEI